MSTAFDVSTEVLPDANQLVREVLAAMPTRVARRLRPCTAIGVPVFTAVVEHGWTPAQLALQATTGLRQVDRISVQDIVVTRLQRAAVGPPPASVVAAARRRRRGGAR